MPITQQRMIELIHAGEDFQQALTLAESLVQSAYSRASSGQTTHQAELDQLGAQIVASLLLRDPIDSASALAVEASHFRRVQKHNSRAARQQRLKRHNPASE